MTIYDSSGTPIEPRRRWYRRAYERIRHHYVVTLTAIVAILGTAATVVSQIDTIWKFFSHQAPTITRSEKPTEQFVVVQFVDWGLDALGTNPLPFTPDKPPNIGFENGIPNGMEQDGNRGDTWRRKLLPSDKSENAWLYLDDAEIFRFPSVGDNEPTTKSKFRLSTTTPTLIPVFPALLETLRVMVDDYCLGPITQISITEGSKKHVVRIDHLHLKRQIEGMIAKVERSESWTKSAKYIAVVDKARAAIDLTKDETTLEAIDEAELAKLSLPKSWGLWRDWLKIGDDKLEMARQGPPESDVAEWNSRLDKITEVYEKANQQYDRFVGVLKARLNQNPTDATASVYSVYDQPIVKRAILSRLALPPYYRMQQSLSQGNVLSFLGQWPEFISRARDVIKTQELQPQNNILLDWEEVQPSP